MPERPKIGRGNFAAYDLASAYPPKMIYDIFCRICGDWMKGGKWRLFKHTWHQHPRWIPIAIVGIAIYLVLWPIRKLVQIVSIAWRAMQ